MSTATYSSGPSFRKLLAAKSAYFAPSDAPLPPPAAPDEPVVSLTFTKVNGEAPTASEPDSQYGSFGEFEEESEDKIDLDHVRALAKRYIKLAGMPGTIEEQTKKLVDFYGARADRVQRFEDLIRELEQG